MTRETFWRKVDEEGARWFLVDRCVALWDRETNELSVDHPDDGFQTAWRIRRRLTTLAAAVLIVEGIWGPA
jgi:hypothetical protein